MFYKIKNLCVAFVAPVYKKNEEVISANSENGFYIIAKQETEKNGGYNYCIDIFNGNKYMCFSCTPYNLLKYNLEKYFVTQIHPISQCINDGSKKISKKELISLYNELNDVEEDKEKIQQEPNKIDDPLLTMLLKTKDKIVESNLSEKEKEEKKETLINLATEYMTLLLKYDKNTGFNSYKYDLWKKYADKVAQIELQLFNNKNNSNNLEEQLEEFQKILKK